MAERHSDFASSRPTKKKVAVIGAGWAGCSAAVALAEQAWDVRVFESARTLGGRARKVEIHGQALDNGQHILLGAYKACLALFDKIGVDPKLALLRLPLQMCYPDTIGGMHFVAPKLPAPFHLLVALLQAKGLHRGDKMALARFSTTARWIDWRLDTDCSVTELLQRFDQTQRLCDLMWNPLCIAALNTPPERASAQIFLNVLRDSLGAKRAASDMLIPRVDLSALMPVRAMEFVAQHDGEVMLGTTVKNINATPDQRWEIVYSSQGTTESYVADAVVIATSADHAASLLANIEMRNIEVQHIEAMSTQTLPDFDYEPITTCYLQYAPSVRLTRPFFALRDQPEQGHWGQFVFDRGQLVAQQAGLFAIVVSASTQANDLNHASLAQAIAEQLAQVFNQPTLAHPEWHKVICEKRATFSCSPMLQRPPNKTIFPNLVIAGDYTQSDYPSTLESAVQSGIQAAQLLTNV